MFMCVVPRHVPVQAASRQPGLRGLRALFGKAQKLVLPMALTCAALVASSIEVGASDPRVPGKVSARYAISFNGFNIGSFRFESEVNGSTYVLNGDAELSALLGAIKWRGVSRSAGTLGKDGPKPAGYTLSFNGNARSGSVKVGFGEGNVTSASIVPPIFVASDEVPLKREHLKDALDPLTAVMALTFGAAKNPCDQKLAVFDGKQRFDLKLSYRGKRVQSAFPGQGGARKTAIVCGVRYQPLGGFRPTGETTHLAKSNGIEIAMLPVPSANIAVPQGVTIPTSYGNVVLTAEKISVENGRRRKVALLSGF